MTYVELATEMSILSYEIEKLQKRIRAETDRENQKRLEEEEQDLQKQFALYCEMFRQKIYVLDEDYEEEPENEHNTMARTNGAVEACYDV